MVIVQLAGGLGNQMFQYALYLQLKSLGKLVKMDDRTGFAQDTKRKPALGPFGIFIDQATAGELERMLDSSPLLWNKVRRKIRGRKKKSYFEADKRYHPEVLGWDDIYLEGYWQTEKYFSGVTAQVKKIYDIDGLLSYLLDEGQSECGANKMRQGPDRGAGIAERYMLEQWLEKINSCESVGIHIRRGDYLLPGNEELFGGICTEAYYKEAIGQMRRQYPGCRFYLFTNDKEWAGERTKQAPDIEVVDGNGLSDHAEFALMGKCAHNILANSSFSWWASYLNKNPDKTVIAPERWLNGWDCRDIYRADMRTLTVR